MKFKLFQRRIQELNPILIATCCTEYHWQVKGGKFLVNVYPEINRIHIDNSIEFYCIEPDNDKAIIWLANWAVKCSNELPTIDWIQLAVEICSR